MLAHAGIFAPKSEQAAVVKWYEAVLAPLGYKKLFSEGPDEHVVGFSDDGKNCDWWIIATEDAIPETPKMHFAFHAKDKEAVHAFHAAALESGAKDNGAPGPRPHYGPTYYAAFVFDPCGYNVEAVCL